MPFFPVICKNVGGSEDAGGVILRARATILRGLATFTATADSENRRDYSRLGINTWQ